MNIFKDNPFHPDLNAPLYQQIYTHLRTAILSGELKGGTKLPSTRALADELGVSRNTILNTYRQLTAEGYLESTEGSGTFVARVLPDLLLTPQNHDTPQNHIEPSQPVFSDHARSQMELSRKFVSLPITTTLRLLSPDAPALNAFPYKLWSQLVIKQARYMSEKNYGYQDAAGYRPLREAIAAHVTVSRQVHCTPEQIVIVSGSQGALDLTSRMLLNAGDSVWLEDPGYFGARGAFIGAKAHIVPVPIDREGMIVEEGIARAPKARLAYLTPSHQYPLGVTMSLARRLAILDWAKRADAYLLEDDYDSEYRFAGRPLAALQGLDDAGRVIYIGTFSKVLFPSLRIGYLILPPPLVDSFLTVRRHLDMHAPVLEQAALADFIAEGHFARHLRRMRILYAERRATLLKAVSELPMEMDSPQAGLRCIGWLPEGMDDRAVIRKSVEHGLGILPISGFCIEPLARKGVLIGYGGYKTLEIKDGVRRLKAVLQSM
ncbi:MAG: PLP-dependent aminotransferase family protein [Anaerolineales bacterium]|nr:PLP-dependent aminotransferase family protein [Anaerolineales bacterium]